MGSVEAEAVCMFMVVCTLAAGVLYAQREIF